MENESDILDLIAKHNNNPHLLIKACENADWKLMKVMLKSMNLDVKYKNKCLKNVSKISNYEMCKLLIDNGADPTHAINNSITREDMKIINLLIDMGFRIHILKRLYKYKNLTSLKILADHGIDISYSQGFIGAHKILNHPEDNCNCKNHKIINFMCNNSKRIRYFYHDNKFIIFGDDELFNGEYNGCKYFAYYKFDFDYICNCYNFISPKKSARS